MRLILGFSNVRANRYCEAYCAFFLLLLCRHITSPQVQQEQTQVVRSNKEARKRLTETNGTPAIDLGNVNVDLKLMYLYVNSGLRNWNGYYY